MTKGKPSPRPAARTTIVGGRPDESGYTHGTIPRGIERAIQKAAVDDRFRSRLLDDRGVAVTEAGLPLADSEHAMLSAIPAEQLEAIIDGTEVSDDMRVLLIGRITADKLAALAFLDELDTEDLPAPAGIEPDVPQGAASPSSRPVEDEA